MGNTRKVERAWKFSSRKCVRGSTGATPSLYRLRLLPPTTRVSLLASGYDIDDQRTLSSTTSELSCICACVHIGRTTSCCWCHPLPTRCHFELSAGPCVSVGRTGVHVCIMQWDQTRC